MHCLQPDVVDAQMIQDTERFKMDLAGSLQRTLHGTVKPSMRVVSVLYIYLPVRTFAMLMSSVCASDNTMVSTPVCL